MKFCKTIWWQLLLGVKTHHGEKRDHVVTVYGGQVLLETITYEYLNKWKGNFTSQCRNTLSHCNTQVACLVFTDKGNMDENNSCI